jgi:ATP-binding cassette subfamily F protein uup
LIRALPPDSGAVKLDQAASAYFDQMRATRSGAHAHRYDQPGSEWVETAGGRRHVLTYLADFLFRGARTRR